ncbi:MAG TPA: transposase, partial [Wenzhouxiangella sp.]|nr:transposase [Wenzhouxiangella sp.]
FLRLAHAYEPTPAAPTVEGIDDFAFRRGHNYGTLVVDLESRRPVDVLVGRSLEVIKAYFQQHPEFKVIARDRDASYAEAVRWAAPQAMVVLDRWHLIRNLAEAFERFVTRRHAAWAHVTRQF